MWVIGPLILYVIDVITRVAQRNRCAACIDDVTLYYPSHVIQIRMQITRRSFSSTRPGQVSQDGVGQNPIASACAYALVAFFQRRRHRRRPDKMIRFDFLGNSGCLQQLVCNFDL